MIEQNIIKLNSGARYQIVNSSIYSLNYAERGMKGSTLGKRLPDDIAKEILETYEKQERVKKSIVVKPKRKKEVKVMAKTKTSPSKKYRKRKVQKVGTAVKLGSFKK